MPLEDPTINRKERFYEPEISEGLRGNRQNREEGRGPAGQLKEKKRVNEDGVEKFSS